MHYMILESKTAQAIFYTLLNYFCDFCGGIFNTEIRVEITNRPFARKYAILSA